MTFSRRRVRPALAVVAFAVLSLVLSACVIYKEGSLRLSQPLGIGPVKVHFELCTEPTGSACAPNEDEGQSQYMIGLTVPKGSTSPAAITATPVSGGPAIVFNRNEEVAREISSMGEGGEGGFPPPGTEAVGYLSAVYAEEAGATREWTVDAGFGLPTAADGGSFGGPFDTQIVYGWRQVDGAHPANRPVSCFEPVGEPPTDATAICDLVDQGSVGTSDLKIGAPVQGSAYVGGSATFAFPLDFATTAANAPSFNLSATSTLPQAKLLLPISSWAPGTPDSTTHRSPVATGTVSVSVPSNAQPGTYAVTLTAATPQGGSVSQVATLQVTKPKLKLGGVKLNKAKGTAILTVSVPSAGTLTVAGKGVVKAKKQANTAKKLKISIKPKGKAKAQLEELGKARVKAKLSFKPTAGSAVKKTKTITLRKT